MRYDREHKQRTRERVLEAAAKAIRAHGPDGVAVAGIMSEVGLTHGGFYAHFSSKDDLIVAAVEAMFEQARRRFAQETVDKPPAAALAAYIDWYLSEAHREARATGCPLTALASDASRMSGRVQDAFGRGAASLTKALCSALIALGRDDAESLARSALAELIGALSLSRAVGDAEFSNHLLESSRAALKRRLGVESSS